MNQKRLQTIALTTTTTVIGTILWLGGSSLNSIVLSSDTPAKTVASETAVANRGGIIPTDDRENLESSPDAMATVGAYQWQNEKAIILRVKNIPVLMFVSPLGQQETYYQSLNLAKEVARRLNEIALQGIDGNQITVEWDQTTGGYSIKIRQEELVQVNDSILLPDTTNNLPNDALQATNRLRRLLGNASPLTTIANLPVTQPPQSITSPRRRTAQNTSNNVRRGVASWYGPGFHGRRTANGERYNQNGLTAAHRYLPFGTKVRVTNLRNGRSVVVRINDRGPFSRGRVIDLSAGAAKIIGVFHSGVAPVKIEVVAK